MKDQTKTPAAVRRWLEENEKAWSGWPSYMVLERVDADERIARLARYGFPRVLVGEDASDLEVLQKVESAIQAIRVDRRKKYVSRQHFL